MKKFLIVGAGASGSALAARLSENAQNDVLVLEAGSVAWEDVEELQDARFLTALSGDNPARQDFEVSLMPGRGGVVLRGRILGGSMSINGGYFMRPRKTDFDAWEEAGGDSWSLKNAKPIFAQIEEKLKPKVFAGDVLTRDFISAAKSMGFNEQPNKNSLEEEATGIGAVPLNVSGLKKIHPAIAYLGSALQRQNLRLHGNTKVLRLIFDRGQVVGVSALAEGKEEKFYADEIILCAGAPDSAHILLLSGIGPAASLESLGIKTVADLPVGEGFSDHPNLAVNWRRKPESVADGETPAFTAALNFDSKVSGTHPEGDVEILFATRPIVGDAAGEMPVLISVQSPVSRGVLRLKSADPLEQPEISYNYLQDETDLLRMQKGVRVAVKILQNKNFADHFGGLIGLSEQLLADEELLTEWIFANLGSAIHMSATAPVGRVVEADGRVKGVGGIRVADTSILPVVPSRGTAYAAVYVAELIAKSL